MKKRFLKAQILLAVGMAGCVMMNSGIAAATDLYGAKEGEAPTGVTVTKGHVSTDSSKAARTGSEFEVTSGTWDNIYGGYRSTGGEATMYNAVKISGGTITGDVYGAKIDASELANYNVVTMNSGTVIGCIFGGDGYMGNVNTINISGGSVMRDVYGGKGSYDAIRNTVNLIGMSGKLDVVVGYDGSNKEIKKTITNTENIRITGTVYGGNAIPDGSQNTLNVAGIGTSVGNIENFDTVNFYLPNAAGTMLNVINNNVPDLSKINTINTVLGDYKLGKSVRLMYNTENKFENIDVYKLQINGEDLADTDTLTSAPIEFAVDNFGKVDGVFGYSWQQVDGGYESLIFETKSAKMKEDASVDANVAIDTILDLNNKTINMQQAADATVDAVKYNTLTVNKLVGIGNLMVDADLANNNSDKIYVTGTGSNATVNLTSILLRSDGLAEGENTNPFTFITGTGAGAVALNYGTDGTLEAATSDYIYTFTNDRKVTKEAAASINDFITGTSKYKDVNTFDVTKDTTVKGALGTIKTADDSTRGKVLTLGINKNVTLNGTKDSEKLAGITVADGYTLNVKGQTTLSATDKQGKITGFTNALTNNGTLNVSDVTLADNDKDIVNNAAMTMTGTNSLNDITGTGTTKVSSGTTTVAKDFSQKGLTVEAGASFTQAGGSFAAENINFAVGDASTTYPMLKLEGTAGFSNVGNVNTNFNLGEFDMYNTISLAECASGFEALSSDKLHINGNADTVKKTYAIDNFGNVEANIGYVKNGNKLSIGTKSADMTADVSLAADATINTTLNLNNKTINMQQAADSAAQYNTLTVKNLTGTGELKVDADFTGSKSDKINVTESGSNANVNLTSILLRSDGLDEGVNDNPFTFITVTDANSVALNYGTDGKLEAATSDYIYTFTNNGKITKETAESINDFIIGEKKYKNTNSFDVTKNTTVKGALGTTTTADDSTRGKVLTLGINKNVTLNGTKDSEKLAGITVADGYTLNVKGQTASSATDKQGKITGFTNALTNNGILNVSDVSISNNDTGIINDKTLNVNNVNFTGNTKDIVNNAAMTMTGTNSLNDITGTGTTKVSSGTTTVAKDFYQKGLTVEAGASFTQAGGSFVVDGDVTNAGDITLDGLGGSDADNTKLETAKNKVTGTLANNGAVNLTNGTYLTLNSFDGNVINVDGTSKFYILGSFSENTKLKGGEGSAIDIAKDNTVTSVNTEGTLNVKNASLAIKDEVSIGTLEGESDTTSNLLVNAQKVADDKVNIKEAKNIAINAVAIGDNNIEMAQSLDDAIANVNDKGIEKFVGLKENASFKMNEGLVFGETVFVADGAGNVQKVVKENEANKENAGALSASASFGRIEMNDIRKRLGDIRMSNAQHGVWTRFEQGKLSGMGVNHKFNKYQVGGDQKLSDKWTIGGAISYTSGKADYNRGHNDVRTTSLAGYGVYTGSNGEFADVIVRLGQDKMDLDFYAGSTLVHQKGSMTTKSFALSGELGKTIDLANNFFVEPQFELSYTHTGGDDFTSNGVNYKLGSMNSFNGRIGGVLGYKDENGTVYTRLSAIREFAGDSSFTASSGAGSMTSRVSGKQTWYEWAIGGQFQTSKSTYVYADVEKTFGAQMNEDYRATMGVRYSF